MYSLFPVEPGATLPWRSIFRSFHRRKVGIFATQPAIKSPLFNFLSEVIATFAFIFILLNLGDFTQGMKPFIVGTLILVIGAGLGTTTGFAINPARD